MNRAYIGTLPARNKAFTLVEIMIVVLIIGLLLAIAVPNFFTAANTSRANSCASNLKEIQNAKQQCIMDNSLPTSYAFTDQSKLVPTYLTATTTCPSGGTYSVNAGNAEATCSYAVTDPRHAIQD